MWKQMIQKLHSVGLGRLCRRGVALSLALSMLLPSMTYAFDDLMEPTALEENEAPTIIIEANSVVNRWYDPDLGDPTDYLTGELEVAIRVKSGIKDDGTLQAFNTLGVALKYDAEILTPCRWTSKWDGTYGKDDREMTLTGVAAADTYDEDVMVSMQTLKNNKISTAAAHVCETVDAGDGYVYIRLDSDRPVVLGTEKRDGKLFEDERGTVLGVISFKYDPESNPILAKDAEQWLSTGTVTDTPATVDDGGAEGDGGDPAPTTPTTATKPLLRFASHAELNDHYDRVELNYNSEKNGMFYSTDPDASRFIDKASTFNRLTLNEETYTEKDIKEHQINFVLTNKTTYNDGGLSLDDLANVLFYDWDDTLIGVLIVPRDGDARKLVNDYVRDNMIHPDLRGADTAPSSLTRTDNYRGKYPATPMLESGKDTLMDHQVREKADGTGTEEVGRTDKLVGSDYPLTNKLDYVFLKRPMARVTTDVNGDPVTTNTWRQKGGLDEPEWDTLYPYIYGWALLPDDNLADIKYTHPKELWTTIGVGELEEYTGLNVGAYESDAVTGEITVNKGGSELLATDSNFQFADFNFMQKGHSLKPGSVYAVKAVYEPGAELLSGSYSYTMVSEPYYNKMNDPAANSGGAYSVDVVYERSNYSLADNTVCGIVRARELTLRQETTSDIRWENEYLENATIGEQAAKTKTTYSTVTVDNTDTVNIQLILSGRHNKVDYFLIEAYGASFVTGGGRSPTNIDYVHSEHVIDNYNYNTDDNDTDRIYYRAEYMDTDEDGEVNDDRSGSYGFVLFGTINNLSQKTEEYLAGKINIQTFSDYLSTYNFADMNLRVNNEQIAFSKWETVQNAWKAAVMAATQLHDSGDDRGWNVEHDRVQFTYHQIQWFVTDYVATYGTGPTLETTLGTDAAHMANYRSWLRTADDADKDTISWCNLHEECAASRSGKPTSFAKMIEVALGRNLPTGKTPTQVLELLDMKEIKAMSKLLANERGADFGNKNQFITSFIDAVTGINKIKPWADPLTTVTQEDWDNIQGWILSTTKPVGTTDLAKANQLSKDRAWWNEGEGAPGNSSLQDLLDAVQKSLDTGRDAWINYFRYRDAFTDMTSKGVSPTSQWTRITENLVKDIDGNAFDDYDQFRDGVDANHDGTKEIFGIKDAVRAMGTGRTWNEYQYYIIHGVDPADYADDTATKEYPSYWWHNGYSRVTDLPSLIVAAQQALAGDRAVWEMFTYDDLYTLKDLHFRNSFNGTEGVYDKSNFEDTGTYKGDGTDSFKDAFLEFIQRPGAILAKASDKPQQQLNSWNQLQYWLIHQDCDLTDPNINSTIEGESVYYWWREGKAGVVFALDPGISEDAIEELNEAIYSAAYSGNPKALDELTEDAAASYRLIPFYSGTEANWDSLAKYRDSSIDPNDKPVQDLKDKLKALSLAAGEDDCWTLTWRQIQHYVRTGIYLEADDASLPGESPTDKDTDVGLNYWWKRGNTNPNLGGSGGKNALDSFLEIIDQYNEGTYEEDFDEAIDLYSGITDGEGTGLNLYGGSEDDLQPIENMNPIQKIRFRSKINALVDKLAEDDPPVAAADVLDWFVLQYYAVSDNPYSGGAIISKEDAKDYYITLLEDYEYDSWAPSYVDVPTGASLFNMALFGMSMDRFMRPDTVVEMDEETGIITVTTTVETYLEITDTTLIVTTVVTIDPAQGTTVTTTTTTLIDWDGTILSETVTTTPNVGADVPIGPTCTCDTETDVHAEDCPLYTEPDTPGDSEGGGETETTSDPKDDPSVGADVPIGPTCTCDAEDDIHAEDCPLYTEPDTSGDSEGGSETESTPPQSAATTAPPQGKPDDTEGSSVGPDDPIGPNGTTSDQPNDPIGPNEPASGPEDNASVGTGIPDGPQGTTSGPQGDSKTESPPPQSAATTAPPQGKPDDTGGYTMETVPEVVDPPLLSTQNDGTINNQAGSEDPPEIPPQTEQQQEGGDDMMTTITDNSGNMSLVPWILLPTERIRRTTSNTIRAAALLPEATTKIVSHDPGRLALLKGELFATDGDGLWRTPKPKIAAPPYRLISISTELFTILENERRAQA